jgi:hypothetical protein
MRKVSKIFAASGLVIVSIGMFGCQAAIPQKAPEAVLQEGINKLADVTSYGYDVNLIGDLKAPQGETPAAINFNFGLKGGVDMKDLKDPKLNLDLKGTFNADANGADGEIALKLNKDAIFLNLMSLVGKGSITVPEELKTQYVAKWWTMPLPPAALAELAKAAPGGDAANMTDAQKKMKALVEETKFFKNAQFVDSVAVGGEDSFHYTAELDKDALETFVAKASELQGTAMSDADKQSMKDSLADLDLSGDIYIGKTSGAMNRMKGTLTLKPNAAKPSPTGTVTFDATLSDLNKPVTIDAPKDAQPIPPEALGALPL